jgi:glutaconate CoA-transferase subunit B
MDCSPVELLTIHTCRLMAGTKTVFAGVGIPLVASIMAKATHTPELVIVVEGGSIDPRVRPGWLPISTNEMRLAYGAQMLAGITDIFLLAQRGFLDLGIIGGAQIDRFGNVNTTVVGPYERPSLRLPGSGGANDIASLCRRIMLVTMHERRRFVPAVDFITSPGYLAGGDTRRAAGLIFGELARVVTNLGLFGFDPATKAMRVEALHPRVTLEDVRVNTGFEVGAPRDVPTTEPPTEAELALVRGIDVEGRYVKG